MVIILQKTYGELLLCMQSGQSKVCLIRPFLQVLAANGQPVNNDFECPLLLMEDKVIVVPVQSVLFPVSIVHECGHTCVFCAQHSQRRIERLLTAITYNMYMI